MTAPPYAVLKKKTRFLVALEAGFRLFERSAA
jgi:hypothetical protein